MMAESKQAHLQFIVFTFFLLYCHSTPVRAKQVEHEIEFDYRVGSKNGPEHWGELNKEWAECKDGNLQSPIGLSDDRVTKVTPGLQDLRMSFKPSDATLKNEGHHIAIEWEGDAGSIQINGTDYFLKQCHWHTPSEHSINGIRYDLELHMVHRSRDPKMKNSVAVVAFLYNIGPSNPFLSKVNKDIVDVSYTKEIHLGAIDPREIKWPSFRFYRYMGSLTTPPCTEGVIWTINERVITVSSEQLELLKQAVHSYGVMNARPLQPLNDRDVKLYGPLLSDAGASNGSISAPSHQEGNQSPEGAPTNAPSTHEANQSPKKSLRLFQRATACMFAYLLLITH